LVITVSPGAGSRPSPKRASSGCAPDLEAAERRHLAEEDAAVATALLERDVGMHDRDAGLATGLQQRHAVGARLLDRRAAVERRAGTEVGLHEVDDEERRALAEAQRLAEAAARVVLVRVTRCHGDLR
jgi:hypothetical protein